MLSVPFSIYPSISLCMYSKAQKYTFPLSMLASRHDLTMQLLDLVNKFLHFVFSYIGCNRLGDSLDELNRGAGDGPSYPRRPTAPKPFSTKIAIGL